MVNLFIVYELDAWSQDLDTDFTLVGCFLGYFKLIKNADPDKYSCSDYSIGLDTRGHHALPDGSVCKNVIVRVDFSSSVHIDNKGKDILLLGKWPTQQLNHILTAETQYSVNFTRAGIKVKLATVSYSLMLQNISVERKRLWNKKVSLVFRKYYKRFHN